MVAIRLIHFLNLHNTGRSKAARDLCSRTLQTNGPIVGDRKARELIVENILTFPPDVCQIGPPSGYSKTKKPVRAREATPRRSMTLCETRLLLVHVHAWRPESSKMAEMDTEAWFLAWRTASECLSQPLEQRSWCSCQTAKPLTFDTLPASPGCVVAQV